MKTIHKYTFAAIASVTLFGLVSCADMSTRDSTVVGAGAGAVTGALITDSVGGAVGGAIVGGVIGHEVGRYNNSYPPDRYYYNRDHGRYYDRRYHRDYRRVRCNDGAVFSASPNVCRYHGGAHYYW